MKIEIKEIAYKKSAIKLKVYYVYINDVMYGGVHFTRKEAEEIVKGLK